MIINAIILGSTGMIGKGVLLECLENPKVESVEVYNKSLLSEKNVKIRENKQ